MQSYFFQLFSIKAKCCETNTILHFIVNGYLCDFINNNNFTLIFAKKFNVKLMCTHVFEHQT